MAPKGKKGKKGGDDDDWEAELGESIANPTNGDAPTADGDANGDDDDARAGGLMAMMSRRREKRKKQGLGEDFEAPKNEEPESAPPAPVEANIDDEFALPEKKAKGGKGGKQAPAAKAADNDDDEVGGDGRMLTKAEKEKLRKEREKARKKEQVRGVIEHGRDCIY